MIEQKGHHQFPHFASTSHDGTEMFIISDPRYMRFFPNADAHNSGYMVTGRLFAEAEFRTELATVFAFAPALIDASIAQARRVLVPEK
jgi:hypothetical protein